VVRLLVYIVRILNGQFLPNDPKMYPSKKGKDDNNVFFGFNRFRRGKDIYNGITHSINNVTSYPNLFDLNFLQRLPDKELHQALSPEYYRQGKAKLAAIEQLLSLYCPPEFVRNVITGLSNEFNITGNLSILIKH
jgi:hypothetical protein